MCRFPPIGWTWFVIAVAFPATATAVPFTLTDVATGAAVPPLGVAPDAVPNGDFTILRIGNDGSTIGDGIDEHTFWVHDFGAHPDFAELDTSEPLTSARLTLVLRPVASPVADRAGILFLPEFRSPLFDALPVGVTTSVEIELLEFYTSDQILSRLGSLDGGLDPRIAPATIGQLGVGYANDAIVSSASLALTGVQVPEPSSLAYLAQSFGALLACRSRRGS